ncbi:MAG: hypothetical protein AABY14_03230, partial [Nanoarchaeota archaeon]
FQYKATVIGEGEPEIEEILHKEYKDDSTIDENLRLAVKALKKVLGENFNIERIDCAYIKTAEKKFTKVTKDVIESALDDKKVKKNK